MIKVLIVDDSAFMRQVFKDHIDKQTNMKTIAIARNGKQALNKIDKYSPDIITLDIEMPEMNGIKTLKYLKNKQEFNIPIIMVSALNEKHTAMDALDLGAFDFITKPSKSLNIDEIKQDLIKKIKAAYSHNHKPSLGPEHNLHKNKKSKYFSQKFNNFPIIAIGSSSGGPKTLKKILKSFPKDFSACIIIVQHMPAGFTKTFAQRLNQETKIDVAEAVDRDNIKKGKALIAPGDYHLEVKNNQIKLNKKPKVFGVRPCVDYMMKSVAKYFTNRVIGVILTGMGHDGAKGMKEIKIHNGYGIVQDKKSALVYGMPQAAIDQQAYDEICTLEQIPSRIIELISD